MIGLMGIRVELHWPAYVGPSNAPLVSFPLAPCIPGDEGARHFVRSTPGIAVIDAASSPVSDDDASVHS